METVDGRPEAQGEEGSSQPVVVFDLAAAEELLDRGRAALERGNRAKALRLFEQALQACPIPAAYNNLALMLLEHRGDPEAALRTLAPNLPPQAHGDGHPFAHALAARCWHRLGDLERARHHLNQAIRTFDAGARQAGLPVTRHAWREYTAAILHAAGALGDDRVAWDLYRRWSNEHVLGQSHYLGGIAAFNLGRFEGAARAWRRALEVESEWRFVEAFLIGAQLCGDGLVPPFRLRYEMPNVRSARRILRKATEEDIDRLLRQFAEDPMTRMLWIAEAFMPEEERDLEQRVVMVTLVANTGEWGRRLAHSVLLSARTSRTLKMHAIEGLRRAGQLEEGQKFRMYVDGRVQEVTYRRVAAVVHGDPELDARHRQALALRHQGRIEEAREILESLVKSDEAIYLPACISYANLLRMEDRLEEARHYLELVRAALPDEPLVLFNLAALCLQEGRLDEAARWLASIDATDPEWKQRVGLLQQLLEQARRRRS